MSMFHEKDVRGLSRKNRHQHERRIPMVLKEKLDALIAQTGKQAPAQVLEVMHRATQDLKNSGIMDGVVKAGDTSPHFTLKNAEGTLVRSEDILKHGPMVLTFYRGAW
jgi:hypothetical protein